MLDSRENFLLSHLSYFRTGGKCRVLYFPKSVEDICEAFAEIAKDGSPYFLLGSGSNSLVSDLEWKGAVISFASMKQIRFENDGLVYVEAGTDNSAFAQACLDQQLEGAAWMNGLPGQIGATIRMNARCYGGEISQIVDKVQLVSQHGRVREVKATDGVFKGYKDTLIMETGEVVAAAWFRLNPGDPKSIAAKWASVAAIVKRKSNLIFPPAAVCLKMTIL